MGGNSATPTTQTTQVNLAPEQRELLQLAMPNLRQFAANPPKLPDFSAVAGFDPAQTQGQEMALAAAAPQADVVGSAADASKRLTSPDLLYADSNPALQSYQQAATRPIIDDLLEKALPAIRGGAAVNTNFGSTRRQIAEGLAVGKAAQAVGDTNAKIANAGYGAGLDAQGKALSLAPQTATALSIPAGTTSAVGDVRQNLLQQILGEKLGRWNYQEELPLLIGKELASLVSGIPTAGATTTASTARSGPTAMTSLGGAASGAALGSMLLPGVGTALGAGAGALLPWITK